MSRSGQALLEYVILLAIVVSLFVTMTKRLSESNVFARLQKPFQEEFARAYRYGHPDARGQDDGGPVNLPQYDDTDGRNFRIFINPMTPDER